MKGLFVLVVLQDAETSRFMDLLPVSVRSGVGVSSDN